MSSMPNLEHLEVALNDLAQQIGLSEALKSLSNLRLISLEQNNIDDPNQIMALSQLERWGHYIALVFATSERMVLIFTL